MSNYQRATVGAWLGLLIGAVYGLMSSVINTVLLRDVSLRVDGGQVFANVVTSGIGLAVAGFIIGWFDSSWRGILIGAGALAGFQLVRSFLSVGGGVLERFGVSYILLVFTLPLIVLFVVFTALLRWGINSHENALREVGRDRVTGLASVWLGAVVLALITGFFSQMTVEEQEAVRRINTLVRNGITAERVPASLQSVTDFRNRASQNYTLDVNTVSSTDFDSAGATTSQFVAVNVYFDNGLVVQCLTGSTMGQPVCTEQ
ncbi:MAG: hypothetical protein ACT4QE_23865 [Anaerolineales bacterium]